MLYHAVTTYGDQPSDADLIAVFEKHKESFNRIASQTVAYPGNYDTAYLGRGEVEQFVGETIRADARLLENLDFSYLQYSREPCVSFPLELSWTYRFSYQRKTLEYCPAGPHPIGRQNLYSAKSTEDYLDRLRERGEEDPEILSLCRPLDADWTLCFTANREDQ